MARPSPLATPSQRPLAGWEGREASSPDVSHLRTAHGTSRARVPALPGTPHQQAFLRPQYRAVLPPPARSWHDRPAAEGVFRPEVPVAVPRLLLRAPSAAAGRM